MFGPSPGANASHPEQDGQAVFIALRPFLADQYEMEAFDQNNRVKFIAIANDLQTAMFLCNCATESINQSNPDTMIVVDIDPRVDGSPDS